MERLCSEHISKGQFEKTYSQNHVKCSRLLCSPPGQKLFADAIINFLIPYKSIRDKKLSRTNFLLMKLWKPLSNLAKASQNFYIVKNFWILIKFSDVVVAYHNFFLVGTRKKNASINFPGGRKNWKNGRFWPPLHKIKPIFHVHAMDIQNFYEFTILNSR